MASRIESLRERIVNDIFLLYYFMFVTSIRYYVTNVLGRWHPSGDRPEDVRKNRTVLLNECVNKVTYFFVFLTETEDPRISLPSDPIQD